MCTVSSLNNFAIFFFLLKFCYLVTNSNTLTAHNKFKTKAFFFSFENYIFCLKFSSHIFRNKGIA